MRGRSTTGVGRRALACLLACLALALGAQAREGHPGRPPAVLIRSQVEVLEASIGMAPRRYPVKEHLSVQVRSFVDDWGLEVSCSDLRDGTRKIEARDIYVLNHGPIRALDDPALVVEDAPDGARRLKLNLRIHPRDRLDCGVYEGVITLQPVVPSGPRPPALEVPFRVTVEARIEHELIDSELSFTVTSSQQDLVDSVRGRLRSDVGVTLTLSADEGRVDRVPLIDRAEDDAPPILLDWAMALDGGAEREADSAGSAYRTWRVDATPDGIEYDLICRPRPATCQPVGTYRKSLVLTVCPSP